ncbi:basic proline-rich protein-like [Pezoporus flaviventris]|uniref:basic proline-rich protein-like n=1 Tax=Pezoporus flaviventris TaxID=889875 RepID=UPI002AB1B391|nr:basic proline-rich protein-like [Pezoporus flaviventris]
MLLLLLLLSPLRLRRPLTPLEGGRGGSGRGPSVGEGRRRGGFRGAWGPVLARDRSPPPPARRYRGRRRSAAGPPSRAEPSRVGGPSPVSPPGRSAGLLRETPGPGRRRTEVVAADVGRAPAGGRSPAGGSRGRHPRGALRVVSLTPGPESRGAVGRALDPPASSGRPPGGSAGSPSGVGDRRVPRAGGVSPGRPSGRRRASVRPPGAARRRARAPARSVPRRRPAEAFGGPPAAGCRRRRHPGPPPPAAAVPPPLRAPVVPEGARHRSRRPSRAGPPPSLSLACPPRPSRARKGGGQPAGGGGEGG